VEKQKEIKKQIEEIDAARTSILGNMVDKEKKLQQQVDITNTSYQASNAIAKQTLEATTQNAEAQAQAAELSIRAAGAQGKFNVADAVKQQQKALEAENQRYEIALQVQAAAKLTLDNLKKQSETAELTPAEIQLQRDNEQKLAEASAVVDRHFDNQQKNAMLVVQQIDRQNAVLAATTSKMEALVALSDNYAIGIGTSMKFRAMQYDAITKQINGEKESLAQIENQLASGTGDTVALEKEREERQAKILGLMNQQLTITKSVRDGWVSAIAAMNTGSGTFTKIAVSQTKAMGVMMKRFGKNAIITNKGGSNEGGYSTSERFSATGDITGADAHRNTAYDTYGDRFFGGGGTRNLEEAGKGNLEAFGREVTARTSYTMGKGGAAIAAGENAAGPSVVTGSNGYIGGYNQPVGATSNAGPTAQKKGNLNINTVKVAIDIKDIKNLSEQIAKQLEPVLNDFVQNISDTLAS